jgi:hypothetical protein
MEKRYYSVESLRDELRGFEDRFGVPSASLFEAYRADKLPAGVPRFEGFVWADTYQEFCRLQGRVPND